MVFFCSLFFKTHLFKHQKFTLLPYHYLKNSNIKIEVVLHQASVGDEEVLVNYDIEDLYEEYLIEEDIERLDEKYDKDKLNLIEKHKYHKNHMN